ncbi:MAG: queuine tRNA-ribosyltransferase family protein [Clostridia bacterium]|nr:queuine tRNA-ribosyltransferase family protein [Clostridia bacterium]
MKQLHTPSGEIALPAFFPDATYGAIRAAAFDDVYAAQLQGCEMNSYHLMSKPGAKLIKSLGGLHRFTGYRGAILTDSGGFQLYSLIRENADYGEIRDREIIFRPDRGTEKLTFTPEKCIQVQFQYGSDIMMALDMCTHPDDPAEVQRRSVELTVKWGKRCREEFDKLVKGRDAAHRPLLFGIVQGGADAALRRECGERLEEIGFDGYGFGGWPLDAEGQFRPDILKMAADAMPDSKVKYAMGLGRPEEIVLCVKLGYSLFDCVIPTREARHQRLYTFKQGMDTPRGVMEGGAGFYRFVYIMDEEHRRSDAPVEEDCDCELCRRYSRAYLHHLFKVNDPQALRLATAHNLRFYGRLMKLLQAANAGEADE